MSRFLKIPDVGETLHQSELERDSCGVGAVVDIQGRASHRVLRLGLDSVCNVTHRGALNSDRKTGDGAGVMTNLPYSLFLPEAKANGVEITQPKDLAVGMFFLPKSHAKIRAIVESQIRAIGAIPIKWREVPTNVGALGQLGVDTMPVIQQLLIKRPEGLTDDNDFERQLYVARRNIEQEAIRERIDHFYIPSLSHRLISYKGFLVATALEEFYPDLKREDYETAICLYHQRFSTNTFPTWALAQPFRMLCHNGEINTLRGNRNWLNARLGHFSKRLCWADAEHFTDVIDPEGSDSASLDAALEVLVLAGRSVPHAMAMLIPPAWRIDPFTPREVADFYKYHSCFSEPWDGPAALAFTDGKTVAACLDRNGLRPARYKITSDGIFSIGSEAGTCHLPDETVIKKGRLAPGEMIVVETETGEVLFDDQIKMKLAGRAPYGEWLKENRLEFNQVVSPTPTISEEGLDPLTLSQQQIAHDYNTEEIELSIIPAIQTGNEAVYSMGDDAALSVLSVKAKPLYTYFKQLFAQVTNPPIDPIREHLVMSIEADLGPERNLLEENPINAKVVHLESPFLYTHQIEALKNLKDFQCSTIDTTWEVSEEAGGLEVAIDRICGEAEVAVSSGSCILILSDRAIDHQRATIPALLVAGSVHHYLCQVGKRMLCSLIIDTGEARDTHQMACIIGFGATAVCPYLGHETVRDLIERNPRNQFDGMTVENGLVNFHKSLEKGVLKIMSKMGISVLNSYQGAQIFEAVGIGPAVIHKCFRGTSSQIGGIGFKEIGKETIYRHSAAFGSIEDGDSSLSLSDPGYFRYRRAGEMHAVTGSVIKNFHTFVKSGDPEDYEKYLEEALKNRPHALHDLFEIDPTKAHPIPLEAVEPVEEVRRRFTTAAMSLGAISPEAHEVLAVAMNRLGGKSDSGEGGEDPRRFDPYPNGDWANSKIKQVASGRFGVDTKYLLSAEELEIKMAQGAKPGEGGQLPGHKVNGLIARLRKTQPGVTLISPPPHHDIYSIEDLAQLIHDLKEVNPRATVTVKLVAESGVGTIAAGVAKANADTILISGHDGGTGASPLSSIKHAGLPWEIGLAETQQVLLINGLRNRVKLRTDGGLRNGRDIIHAALLGAEEFNFGTIALIAIGCVYVRRCHLNNCPVGVATQDPKYRAKFKGKVEHVINFFNAVAEETRRHMAAIGVAKMDDLIGQVKYLRQRQDLPPGSKAATVDLSKILADPAAKLGENVIRICTQKRNDGIHLPPLDDQIIKDAASALENAEKVTLSYAVKNTHRNIGTKLSGKIADIYGNHGLPEGTLNILLSGSAGQSFGTFLCGGIRLDLTGEANDYVGKGMCGGEIVIRPPLNRAFVASENSIVGNTVMYGASGGHLFANGRGGERFCVRNSGGTSVIEGIGDHGCEYMTNGTVVIIGPTGKNFGAGMSGGSAYVLDEEERFEKLYNPEMVEILRIETGSAEAWELRALIEKHRDATGSEKASSLLENWIQSLGLFWWLKPKGGLSEIRSKKPALAKV